MWLVVHPGAAVRTVGVSACRTSGGVAGGVVAAWVGVGRLHPSVGVGPGWVRGGWCDTVSLPSVPATRTVAPAGLLCSSTGGWLRSVCFAHGGCHGCSWYGARVPMWVCVCGSHADVQPGGLSFGVSRRLTLSAPRPWHPAVAVAVAVAVAASVVVLAAGGVVLAVVVVAVVAGGVGGGVASLAPPPPAPGAGAWAASGGAARWWGAACGVGVCLPLVVLLL